MEEETIVITKKRYYEMQEEIFFLSCLRQAGVDNWEGYDIACELYAGQPDE